jgi:putative Ca2+/H+ antiporter (TMEM165/GDT1 family)
MLMEAFLVSTLAVAIGELGDKTQLLALVLAARFRRPIAVILGILCATIANHACAGLAGAWLRGILTAEILRWLVGVSFLAIAAWALVPDRMEEERAPAQGRSAFLVTLVAFFFAEFGDKTQVATLMLAARYENLVAVVAGSTLGMLCADAPAVALGTALPFAIPFRAVRLTASALFGALGAAALLGFGPF